MIRDKDYFIIKVRWYADKKLLDKIRVNKEPLPRQHYDRSKAFIDFEWKLIEHCTGKESSWWYGYYPLNSKECALEELGDKDILYEYGQEGNRIYYVPKTNPELKDWIFANIPDILPIKMITRYSLMMLRYNDKSRYQLRREDALDFKKRMLKENPDLYNKIFIV